MGSSSWCASPFAVPFALPFALPFAWRVRLTTVPMPQGIEPGGDLTVTRRPGLRKRMELSGRRMAAKMLLPCCASSCRHGQAFRGGIERRSRNASLQEPHSSSKKLHSETGYHSGHAPQRQHTPASRGVGFPVFIGDHSASGQNSHRPARERALRSCW